MTKLEEKAAEYSFNIPSQVYQSCKTQEEMELWKNEIESAYINGYNQCFQDFLEKAEEFFKSMYETMGKPNLGDKTIEQFKNYMEDESEK